MYFHIYFRLERLCKRTTVVNGVVIPGGAVVLIPIYLLQNNPLYWKDPCKFDPDRYKSCSVALIGY